jgi:hypothetical protein
VKQNAISPIENGAGGGINVLLKLLNFYNDFFVVEHILSPKFEVIRISDSAGPMESVAIERLKLWKVEFNEEIEKIIDLPKTALIANKNRSLVSIDKSGSLSNP